MTPLNATLVPASEDQGGEWLYRYMVLGAQPTIYQTKPGGPIVAYIAEKQK